MPEGYSKKALAAKLGIKEGTRIALLNQPKNYREILGRLPSGVTVMNKPKGPVEFIHYSTTSRKELENMFPRLKKNLAQKGMLWISWPKGSANVETDLKANVVIGIGLQNGLVDVKVAAIDETWSGLKFVYRLKDRK
jgi:hypothetical protein